MQSHHSLFSSLMEPPNGSDITGLFVTVNINTVQKIKTKIYPWRMYFIFNQIFSMEGIDSCISIIELFVDLRLLEFYQRVTVPYIYINSGITPVDKPDLLFLHLHH